MVSVFLECCKHVTPSLVKKTKRGAKTRDFEKKLVFGPHLFFYFTIRGGSLKKMAKKIIPKVPTNKKVYTNASIEKICLLCTQTLDMRSLF